MCFLKISRGIVTAIVRLAVFFTADMFADITWHCIEFLTWTTIEPGIYLIAACLPSLRPLFRKMFKDCDFGSIWARIRSYAFKIPRQTNDSQAVSLNAINAARKTTLMVVDPSPDFKQLEENNSSIYSGDDRRGFMAWSKRPNGARKIRRRRHTKQDVEVRLWQDIRHSFRNVLRLIIVWTLAP